MVKLPQDIAEILLKVALKHQNKTILLSKMESNTTICKKGNQSSGKP
jgi:hypothetical protein